MATPIAPVGVDQSLAMSEHLVRVENLRRIQRMNGWNDAELARACKRSQQQVYSWFTGTRQIGERLARRLEDALHLLAYTLDDRASVHKAAEPPPAWGVEGPPGYRVTSKAVSLPAVTWQQIGTMLEEQNAALQGSVPHLETFAPASERAKFVTAADDSMAPEIQPGDHVVLDPAEAPSAGDVVLVRSATGEFFLRTFRPRGAHAFEAAASNPAYATLTSVADGLVVHAVMIEHRRYRRRSTF